MKLKKFQLSGVQVLGLKLYYRKQPAGKRKLLWSSKAGGSSYGGFELPGVDCIKNHD